MSNPEKKISAEYQAFSDELRKKMPEEMLQAEAYYEELKMDPEWLKAHDKRHLYIIGREVVGVQNIGENYTDFSKRVRSLYGYGPIFAPFVEVDPQPEIVLPLIRHFDVR